MSTCPELDLASASEVIFDNALLLHEERQDLPFYLIPCSHYKFIIYLIN